MPTVTPHAGLRIERKGSVCPIITGF